MKKFLITYHAPASAIAQFKNATHEEVMKATEPWMAWRTANEANIVDFGSRLLTGQERSVNSDWATSGTEVTGFSILQAESLEAVQATLQNHPQLYWDPSCRVSVYEFQSM